jgi:hypothetical protein
MRMTVLAMILVLMMFVMLTVRQQCSGDAIFAIATYKCDEHGRELRSVEQTGIFTVRYQCGEKKRDNSIRHP